MGARANLLPTRPLLRTGNNSRYSTVLATSGIASSQGAFTERRSTLEAKRTQRGTGVECEKNQSMSRVRSQAARCTILYTVVELEKHTAMPSQDLVILVLGGG